MNPVPSQPIPAATVESRRIRSPGSRPSGLPHPRLSLQRRAPRTLRRHLGRAALRLTVLVTADLAAFGLLRELYRLVGEREALGPGIGGAVQRLLPVGYLDGWQFAVALVIGLLVTRNYGAGDARRDPVRLLWGCTLATAMSLWAPLWQRGATVVAVQFLVTTGVAWLGLVAMRFALDYVDAHVVARTPASFRTLLVGPSEACKDLAARPAFAPRGEHAVLGYVDVKLPLTDGALGHVTDLAYLIQKHRVESVVICGHVPEEITRDVVDHAVTAGCHVFAVPPAFEVANVQPSVVWKRGQPVVELTAQTLKAQQFAVKRVMDVVGAVAGIVLLAPVLLLVALVIRLDSPGPVLFRQRRVGIGGRPFEILKFRTMTDGAEALKPALAPLSTSKDPRIFKMPDDPRVSRVGRFLRRWAIDELPQLWNVLRGEMSLVGPRPFVVTEFDCYQAHHFSRLGAKPGITGLWQVRRSSATVDFEEVMALDAQYIREWSLLLDLKILFLTIPAVVRGRGVV